MSRTFGSRLKDASALSKEHTEKLERLAITTFEQVIALCAVKGGKEGLALHLGVSPSALGELVQGLKKHMSGRSIAAMEEPYAFTFSFGALEPPLEKRLSGIGPFEASIPIASLPTSVNYVSRMPGVRNQGQRGTCVAFACTALNEDFHRSALGSSANLSEQCLYMRCKEVDGNPSAEGTNVSVGMDCLVKFGQSSESCEPYNPNPPTNQPGAHPQCCALESPKWKIPQSIQLNAKSVNDIKAALALGKVVAFSIPVFHSWYDSAAVAMTGDLTMPLPQEQAFAGHAMLFVGYQDEPSTPGGGYFILRNSWGTTWAPHSAYTPGYGTIPYQYMADQGWEAFATDLPNTCVPRPIAPVCPPVAMICPVGPKSCPVHPMICPARPTICPPQATLCPPQATICPPKATICPPQAVFCPPRPIVCPPSPIPYCPRPAMPICPGAPFGPGPGPGPDPGPESWARYPGYGYPGYSYPYYGYYQSPQAWYGGQAQAWGSAGAEPCACQDQGADPAWWYGWPAWEGQGGGYDPQVSPC
jgi:hypothetical protein